MGHFAEINSDNVVQRVLVIEQEEINTGAWGSPDNWIKTSYNTKGGKHYSMTTTEESIKVVDPREWSPTYNQEIDKLKQSSVSETSSDGDGLRKNYAGIGYTYNASRDAFYAPQPYPSWTLDDDTCIWNAPTAYPDDGKMYDWDEDTTEWVEVE